MRIERLLETAIYGPDLEALERFYVELLGLEPVARTPGWNVVLAELPAWRARLAAAGVAIEAEVPWPDGHRSLYFRDPAGNSVELAPPTLWQGLGYRAAPPVPRDA